jgi:hypothetical protein
MAKAEFPRRGAWAKLADGTVGVIASVQGQAAEFHAVDTKGETTTVIGHYDEKRQLVDGVPFEFLTQAGHGEIPRARRPNKEVAHAFGYK